MNINTHNLNALGVISAVLLILSGCIVYYRNYKDPAKKTVSRVGLLLVVGGTLLLVWPLIFK